MIEVKPRGPITGTVNLPGSKSVTHRALIAAALAEGSSTIENFLECEDTLCTMDALRSLGATFSRIHGGVSVSGTGGRFRPELTPREVYLGNSGTSYRFMMSIFGLASGEYVLTGTQRMARRPVGGLVRALNALGGSVSHVASEGFPPVVVRAGGIRGGRATVEGGESSQFVSSLLLAAPHAREDTEIVIKGKLVSAPYVDITLEVMERFGIRVHREGYGYFRVEAGQRYQAGGFAVEGDVSSASYFWAAAAVSGGTVTTTNINTRSRQGDMSFLDVLREMGCRIEVGKKQITVRGGSLRGIDADMSAMPDLVPTLAAVAPFAEGKTAIRNVPHLRHKESDRLHAVAVEWEKLGGRVEEMPDGLVVHGDGRLSGAVVDPHDDHRIAMSLAVVGLRVPGIKINNEKCIDKSFPVFWETWERM